MSYADWKDQISGFKTIDVRGIQGNFFQGLKKQAMALSAGGGLEIIRTGITGDARPGREDEKWLNVLLRAND